MIERGFEKFLFGSRWLLAPFYGALVVVLFVLLMKAMQELWHFVTHAYAATESQIIVAALTLIDLTFTGSLIIIVIFSGYENFVSKFDKSGHEDWPEWAGKVDFSGLKLKLMSTIVAISAIQVLKAFMSLKTISDRDLYWYAGIHMVFVVSGLMMAWTDKITATSHAAKPAPAPKSEHKTGGSH